MNVIENLTPIDDDELLARFVFFRSYIRPDNTVTENAFIPPPNRELSVMRHADLKESGIWEHGISIAIIRQIPLLGRADLKTYFPRKQGLSVEPLPPPRNHVVILLR